jgi:threonine-phosphate decarboxylase
MSVAKADRIESFKLIARDRAHGGVAPGGAIDFSASINPLGPPPAALAEYHRAVDAIACYPATYPGALAGRIAEWIGVGRERLLVGNGSTHLIYLITRNFNWRRAIIVTPTFSEIANALIAAGSAPRAIELDRGNDFELRFDQIADALRCGADAIFIGRPNSPSGTMTKFAEACAIAGECARYRAKCIFDEAFIDFAAGGARSAIELVAATPDVIVLRSLTKIFAIPGLRLGFLVASPATIAWLREQIEPWAVNGIAERVGIACLESAAEHIRRTHELVTDERDYVRAALAENPDLHVYPSAANFLMVAARGETGESKTDFGTFMLERGIALRDLRGLPGGGAGLYRIGIRTHDDNQRLVRAANEFRVVNRR